MICVNPFSDKSDQYQFSPDNFNIFLREKVQRIYKMITKEEMLLSFIIFLSQNGSLKNDVATNIVVVFPLWPIFCRIIISKSTYYYFIIDTTACKTFLAYIKNGRHELLNEVEETARVVYKDILDWIQQKLP